MQQYNNYILHVDAKGIASMFMAGGELAGTEMSVKGKDSIENFLDQFKYIKVTSQKSTTDSIHQSGDTIFQYGKYNQRAIVNKDTAEVHGMFKANWVIQPDGKLLLQRMYTWNPPGK